ncbi:MAG TPA: DUF4388 domain-containing protein [Polyangiaceae bacterium]
MGARILIVDDSPTIRKVVSAILERRDYETLAARDGQEALSTLAWRSVDLILLDFVMPRMNGYQFCRELRANEKLKELPVILMSAKADKIRGQFVQQTGAIDAITKPFDARGLVAVVEHALHRTKEGRGRPIPDAQHMPAEEPRESIYPAAVRISLSDDPGLRQVQASQEVGNYMSQLLTPELRRAHALRGDDALLGRAIQQAITPECVTELGALLKNMELGEESHEVLSGDLSVIALPEVLQMLQMQRQTGALKLMQRSTEVTLYLGQGNLDYAANKGLPREYLLGRYLIQSKAVSRKDLRNVLENRAGSLRLLGETLVRLQLVTEEQVKRALVQQTSELLYEVVRWKKGRFQFVAAADNPIAKKSELQLAVGGLIMEGFRRVDEWQLIEGSFDFNEVLFRDQAAIKALAERSKLTAQERAVLDAINGERTVREIVDVMGGSSFELCKILYQFLNSRLVRRHAA